MIVGIVVGVIFAIFVVVVVFVCYLKKKKVSLLKQDLTCTVNEMLVLFLLLYGDLLSLCAHHGDLVLIEQKI